MADHLRTSLIIEALAAALLTRQPPKGVIFHSDRGCQYTSQEFADFCAANGVRRSMGRRATCFEVSRRRESHPPPLAEPCVKVALHTAPTVEPVGIAPCRQ